MNIKEIKKLKTIKYINTLDSKEMIHIYSVYSYEGKTVVDICVTVENESFPSRLYKVPLLKVKQLLKEVEIIETSKRYEYF